MEKKKTKLQRIGRVRKKFDAQGKELGTFIEVTKTTGVTQGDRIFLKGFEETLQDDLNNGYKDQAAIAQARQNASYKYDDGNVVQTVSVLLHQIAAE